MNKLILFGERSVRNAVINHLAHCHTERCDQGLANELIFPMLQPTDITQKIETVEQLGGLL